MAAGGAFAILFLLALPTFGTAYTQNVLIQMFTFVALASSWNIISGFTGYMSFGHVAFFGLGAYTYALLVAGGVLATALAAAIGLTCLRLHGHYFAIATLGLGEALRIAVLGWDDVTGGGNGILLTPVKELVSSYYGMALVAALAIGLSWAVARSRFGLSLLAVREGEVAAGMLGINTTACKLWAFMLSAVAPGMAGALHGRFIGFIEPASIFAVLITVQMAVFALFGGRGTVSGPILGTCLLFLFQEQVWARFPYLHLFIFGLVLVLTVLLMPKGLLGLLQDRGWIAKGVVR
jgi:branched-chain amino acid transport system permease protein